MTWILNFWKKSAALLSLPSWKNNMQGSSVEYEICWRRSNISATTTDVLLFMSHLWPNFWSHKVPQGTKWKIWTRSFYWYHISPCGISGLAVTASQSQAFFGNDQKCWKWAFSASCKIPLFWKLFFKTIAASHKLRLMNFQKI